MPKKTEPRGYVKPPATLKIGTPVRGNSDRAVKTHAIAGMAAE
jgi:hypothetical protein